MLYLNCLSNNFSSILNIITFEYLVHLLRATYNNSELVLKVLPKNIANYFVVDPWLVWIVVANDNLSG